MFTEIEPYNNLTHETRIIQKLEFETSEVRPSNTNPRTKDKLDCWKSRQNDNPTICGEKQEMIAKIIYESTKASMAPQAKTSRN